VNVTVTDEVSIMVQQDSPRPLRILYTEDNPLVREITCELLARDTREIVAVGSGEEALATFKDNRFDIVVTDVSLPEMSGVDLIRFIKRLDPSIPVIVVSGYALDRTDLQLGPSVRAITKPFDVPQMDALIRELCDSGSGPLPT
jgi:two-component system cell cycle response regulator CpdR